jgi:hypothetical protein
MRHHRVADCDSPERCHGGYTAGEPTYGSRRREPTATTVRNQPSQTSPVVSASSASSLCASSRRRRSRAALYWVVTGSGDARPRGLITMLCCRSELLS